MNENEYPDTYADTYSVREHGGKWAVYGPHGRLSRYYDTRQDAIFLGVRDVERRVRGK